MRFPFFPHHFQHLLLLVLLIIAIQTGMRWYLTVVLICLSQIASKVEHLYVYLLAFCVSSWEKCLYRFSAHFLIRLSVWYFVWVLYIFWNLTPCWSCCLQIPSLIQLAAFFFCWQFLSLCRSFLVWYSPLHLFLPLLAFWGQINKIFSKAKVHKFSTYDLSCYKCEFHGISLF